MTVKTLPVMFRGNFEVNCYVVSAGGENAVIDPGAEPEKILGAIGGKAKYVLLTHRHPDHTGALEEVLSATGAELLADMPDGTVTRLGGGELKWLRTPGHTPDSCCVIAGDSLITGDTLFRGDCGRTDLPGGDWELMKKSLRRLHGLEGDFKVLPGHEESSTLEAERRDNSYMAEALKG